MADEKTYNIAERDLKNIIMGFNNLNETTNNIAKIFTHIATGIKSGGPTYQPRQSGVSNEKQSSSSKSSESQAAKRAREYKEKLKDLNQEMINNFTDYLNEYEFITEKSRKIFEKGIKEYNKSTTDILLSGNNSIFKQLKNESLMLRKRLDRLAEAEYINNEHDLRVREKILKAKIDSHPLLNPGKYISDALTKGISNVGSSILGKLHTGLGGDKTGFGKLVGIGAEWTKIPGEVIRTQEKQRKHIISESSPKAKKEYRSKILQELSGRDEKTGEYKLSKEDAEAQVILSELNDEQRLKVSEKTESILKRKAKSNKRSLKKQVTKSFLEQNEYKITDQNKEAIEFRIDKYTKDLESKGISSGKRYKEYSKLQEKYINEATKDGKHSKNYAFEMGHSKAAAEIQEKYKDELDPTIGITVKDLFSVVTEMKDDLNELTEEGTTKGSIYVADDAVKEELKDTNEIAIESQEKLDDIVDAQPTDADKFRAGLHQGKSGSSNKSGTVNNSNNQNNGGAKEEKDGLLSKLLNLKGLGKAGSLLKSGVGLAGGALTSTAALTTGAVVGTAALGAATGYGINKLGNYIMPGTQEGKLTGKMSFNDALVNSNPASLIARKTGLIATEKDIVNAQNQSSLTGKTGNAVVEKDLSQLSERGASTEELNNLKNMASDQRGYTLQLRKLRQKYPNVNVDTTSSDIKRLEAEQPTETITNLRNEENTIEQQKIMIKQQKIMIKQNEEIIKKPAVIFRTYMPSPSYNNPIEQMGVR